MRQEELEPRYIHHYKPEDKESLKKALQQYAEWVLTGQAFKKDYCVVVFEPETEVVTLNNFKEQDSIYSFLKKLLYNIKMDEENINHQILTETLLFAYALKFPELKEEVVSTSRAFVDYARAINDSSKMWITCENPFAVEPLCLLAEVYPDYGFLLTAFFIPYWDDEHMIESISYPSTWSTSQGINHNTIKAFCYCDNSMVREEMLGYSVWDGISTDTKINSQFDLMQFFRKSDNHFQLFKDILVDRFNNMPFMPYCNEEEYFNVNPIRELVIQMMMVQHPMDTCNEDFDITEYLTQTFIKDQAEIEIREITSYVEEKLGHPIVDRNVFKNNAKLLRSFPEKEQHPLHNWKDFIIKEIPEGQNIWEYINNGNHPEILKSVKKTNIFYLAENGYYDLYDELERVSFNMEYLWEDLSDLLKPLYHKLNNWSLKNNTSRTNNKTLVLRLIDVLFALNGKVPVSPKTEKYLINVMMCINQDDFNKRFRAPWFNKLETSISKFDQYSNYVSHSNIEAFHKIILENYTDAIEQLPEKLFKINDKQNYNWSKEDCDNKKYGKKEILIVAAKILHHNTNKQINDALTYAARKYINHYAVGFIFYDLIDNLKFPQPYILEDFRAGKTKNYSDFTVKEYEEIKEPLNQLEQYFYHGIIQSDNHSYSSWESEEMANNIIDKYIEYDDNEISDKQKQINWLRSFEGTQKLLYVAHLCSHIKGLNNSDALLRFLKTAFRLAPVRTCHLLTKVYQENERESITGGPLRELLDIFKTQGLSPAGYWAYHFEVYANEGNGTADPYYRAILRDWKEFGIHSIKDHFFYHIIKNEKKALNEASQLIPRRTQIELINDLTKIFPEEDFSNRYDMMLINRIIRELKKKYKIHDLPVYFKNRLIAEGHYCEYIQWSAWNENPELFDQIIQQVKIEKPTEIIDDDYLTQLQNKGEWGYLILQKKGIDLVPVLGHKLLWLIQNSCNSQNINSAQTNIIIIDESCPQNIVNELLNAAQSDYKKLFIQKIISFLASESIDKETENLLRYGIYDYDFMRHENYFDIDLEDILTKVSRNIQTKTFQLLALISHKCLNVDMDMKHNEYFELLLSCNVDQLNLLKYLIWLNRTFEIQQLARKIDISDFIEKLKLEDLILILSLVAPLPPYHPLIIKMESHQSAKIREHVQKLKDRFNIHDSSKSLYHIVDYGVYQINGSSDPENGSNRKVAREPVCIKSGEHIKAVKGMYIGFRFTSTVPAMTPKVLNHKVKVTYPSYDGKTQKKYNSINWEQNGYSASKIFLGWHFETEEELIPGDYTITALDLNGNTLAQKKFIIELI